VSFEASGSSRSRYAVHGTRLAVSTASRSSGTIDPAPKHRTLPWTWPSLQGTRHFARRSPARLRHAPHGVSFPFSDVGREVHWPGLPHPVRSACRVSRPLDGLLPHLLSDLEGRYRSWGLGPPEPYPSAEPYASRRLNPHAVPDIACSCSEDQEVTMPRNSRALLSAEIRTSGRPGSATADALMGFSPF
jgi:hypothetical protein